ncbi:MAG: hypothetical protein ABFC38_11820 [Methanospirillum sp.]
MGADGEFSCGRCGTQYLRRADPEHCSGCGREIGAEASQDSRRRFGRYLCPDCAERKGWE